MFESIGNWKWNAAMFESSGETRGLHLLAVSAVMTWPATALSLAPVPGASQAGRPPHTRPFQCACKSTFDLDLCTLFLSVLPRDRGRAKLHSLDFPPHAQSSTLRPIPSPPAPSLTPSVGLPNSGTPTGPGAPGSSPLHLRSSDPSSGRILWPRTHTTSRR